MSGDKEQSDRREVRLTSDQFNFNEDGELVIKNEALTELLKSQVADAEAPEAGGGVGIGIVW